MTTGTWNGNENVFVGYLPGKNDEKGQGIPACRVSSENLISIDQALSLPVFGGILKPGVIDISFDSKDISKAFLKMMKAKRWKCLVLVNPTNGHIHTFWRNTAKRVKKNAYVDTMLACGFKADIHGGKTYIRLKEQDHSRVPPLVDCDSPDEVPVELLPVKTKAALWGMGEGDGRNSTLYSYILTLQKQLHLSNDEVREVLFSINDYVFASPLPGSEIETITRPESMKKYEPEPLHYVNARDLEKMNLPDVYFLVEGLLPVGLSILASPPKFGKSFLALQLAIAVAEGSSFLGFQCNKNGVLYLALEDSLQRLKSRLAGELNGKPFPELLDFDIKAPALSEGLTDYLEKYLNERPKTRLIILDTFQKVRDGAKKNEGAYASDYRETGVLKRFADDNGIGLLLIHHTRKGLDPDDPFSNISGTMGVSGAADTLMVMTKKKRADELTKLSITGRDIEQNDYAISRDEKTGLWKRYEDSIEELQRNQEERINSGRYFVSNLRKTLCKALEGSDSWKGTCSDLIKLSQEYGTPIAENPVQLSKAISDYETAMIKTDHIHHVRTRNGSGAGSHRFFRTG